MIHGNNPGNIRVIQQREGGWGTPFDGEIRPPAVLPGATSGFRVFNNLISGYRAIFVLLKNAYLNQGFDTIAKIFPRYAPKADNNNPTAYIKSVEQMTGINANQVLNTYKDLKPIVKAITKVETGINANDEDIENAYLSLFNPIENVLNPSIILPSETTQVTKQPFFIRNKKILIIGAVSLALIGGVLYYEKKKK